MDRMRKTPEQELQRRTSNTPKINGYLPFTASGIVDVNGVSQPSQLNSLQQISLWKSDKVINVLTGNPDLVKELEWQQQMDEKTKEKYQYLE